MYKLASVKLWLFVLVTAASIWLCYLGRINGLELAALLSWAYGVYCAANVMAKKTIERVMEDDDDRDASTDAVGCGGDNGDATQGAIGFRGR